MAEPVPEPVLRFLKLSENSSAPTKRSDKAAGFELRSAYDYEVPARGKAVVRLDLKFEFPEDSYGRIAPLTNLAAKHSIAVGGGVIDRDFQGNVSVVLFNHSDVDFPVSKGDRIAQLICERIFNPKLEEM